MTTGLWSQEEHANFLTAIKLYPHGPWRKIAEYIGTRSIRQTQTHAQKYHEKVVRRMRGLHKGRRSSTRNDHRIDDDMLAACKVGEGFGVVLPKDDKAKSLSPQQSSTSSTFGLMVPLLMSSMSGSMSPNGVDSNDTISDSMISYLLPTYDESLDFLIENFEVVEVEIQL
ncbi:myb-like dna-binding [Plasmopara halstedii]|uniref:Myb-like dna-binding n=1 Tax=Plasmopara halstedii TaxID=4781 RepID=A0A0P1ATT6_PLAHL|nr:myb-like dna-binding [Plasmopara halstedii]CEG44281.1 myb-like dna-binding [Plasmopara halstedii]|eukprot:XP_024580650.1 myb-like dna-binding [Plasmopara halstedii]